MLKNPISLKRVRLLLISLFVGTLLLSACSDPRYHEPPHDKFYQVGLFGHGRGALGDMRINYFGLERRCDSCHRTELDQHGDLGTCNRCHQPHVFGWENTLYAREHAQVMTFVEKEYHARLDCVECHQNLESAATFTQASCNHCHNHGKSDIDYSHDLMDDYDYRVFSQNSACISCHSRTGKSYAQYNDPESGDLL